MIIPITIYIAGQIKGLPIETAKANFELIENKLRELGYQPVNPMNLGMPDDWEYLQARPQCLAALEPCEGIYIQSNWRKSDGTKDEIHHAMKWGLNLYYAEARGMETLEELARHLFQREV